MSILVLFGAVICLQSAVLSKPEEIELSQMATDRIISSGLLKPEGVKRLIAAQGPEYAKKIANLFALMESIDFGCEDTSPENFKSPNGGSKECGNLKLLWERIFGRLGWFLYLSGGSVPENVNMDEIEKIVKKVAENPSENLRPLLY